MSTSPSLGQIAGLIAIAETASVSAAARRLGLTQPAASQQLRALERRLGVRLMERAGGRMRPSAAGAALLDPARAVLAAVAELEAEAARHRAGHAGRVRLGTGATACVHLLPPVLAALRAAHPGIEIAITTGDTPEMLAALQAGTLDAGFVTLPAGVAAALPRGGAWRGLALAMTHGDGLCAVVPEAMLADRDHATPGQLGTLPLILYEASGATRALIDAWFADAGVKMRPVMALGNVEAIKMMVATGIGATILPCAALGGAALGGAEAGAGTPVAGARVLALRPVLTRRLGLVLRRDKLRDNGLRALIAAMAVLADAPRPARRR